MLARMWIVRNRKYRLMSTPTASMRRAICICSTVPVMASKKRSSAASWPRRSCLVHMSLRSRMVPPKWKRIRAELIDPSRLEGRDHGLIGQPQEADSFHAHDSLRFAERFLRLRIRDEVAQRDRIKGNPKEHRRGCL